MTQFWRVPERFVYGIERWYLDVYPEPNDPSALHRYLHRYNVARSKGVPKSNKARRKLRNWARKYSPPTHYFYMSEEAVFAEPGLWSGRRTHFTVQERVAASEPVDFEPPVREPFFGVDRNVKSTRLAGYF